MQKIVVGKITKAHGLKGEMKVLPLLNDVNLFKNFKNVFIDNKQFEIENCKIANKQIILSLNKIDNIDLTQSFLNKSIEVEKDLVTLAENEYFIADLIGCNIFTFEHKLVGKVDDISNFGASDVIFIKNKNAQLSLPHIDNVFEKVDVENKEIVLSKFGEGVLCDEN